MKRAVALAGILALVGAGAASALTAGDPINEVKVTVSGLN
jgi:hypothetical protein